MEKITIEVDGVGAGEYRLTDTLYEIGRSHDCAVRVNVPDVSRKHVCLERSADGWYARPLSERGVVLNDVIVAAGTRASLSDGAVLLLGEHTVVRFVSNAQADEKAEAVAEPFSAPTGSGGLESVANTLMPRPGSSGSLETVPPAALPADALKAGSAAEEPVEDATGLGDFAHDVLPEKDEDGTFGGGEAGGPATLAFDGMHTQMVDEETLAKLRDKLGKQSRRRSLPILGVLASLAVVGVIGFFGYRHFVKPEEDIPFPMDKKGNVIRMEHVFPVFDTRLSGKGVFLLLPGVADGVPDDKGNVLKMTVRMWGDRSIRMAVMCKAEENARFLAMTRDALLSDWIASANVGGSLVFEAPTMAFQFVGKKTEPPGIPVDLVKYENTATSGRGVVYMVRTGMKRIILQMEVPEKDYEKLELALTSPKSYFRVDRTLMERHWEPSTEPTISSDQARDYIDRCRLELGRQAPSVWHDIYMMLTSVLRYASEKSDKEMERFALEMLVTLRDEQENWFRGKRNDRETALNRGEHKAAILLREECRMVFSSPDDIRFNETRDWK